MNNSKYGARNIFQYNAIQFISLLQQHTIQIKVTFDFSQHFGCELYLYFISQSSFNYFHFNKISYFAVITVHKKPADFEDDMNLLQVMQHAHYPTGTHVTTPVTYKYPQSVRCSTDTQNTKHELHSATVCDSLHCGSYRIIPAVFSAL
jgi:hypothetical protein